MEWYGWLILGVIAFIMIAGGYFWLTDKSEKPHKPVIHYGGWRETDGRGRFRPSGGDGGGDGGGGGGNGGGG